jgi:hypothetical protein
MHVYERLLNPGFETASGQSGIISARQHKSTAPVPPGFSESRASHGDLGRAPFTDRWKCF